MFNRKSLKLRIRSVAPDPEYRLQSLMMGKKPEVVDIFGPSDKPNGWNSITRCLEVNTSFGAPGFERQFYLWFVYFRKEERLQISREHLGMRNDRHPILFHPDRNRGSDQITTYEIPVPKDGSKAVVWLKNESTGRDINYWLVKSLGASSRFSLGYLNEEGAIGSGSRRQLVFNLPKQKPAGGATQAPASGRVNEADSDQAGARTASAESDYEDPDTVVLATTDAEHAVFRFRLRPAREGER
jgi:hypothetical protein